MGPEERLRALEDLLRLGHPPHSKLALGRLALVGADQLDASLAERRRVRLGRRVRPHARVHRGSHEHRPAVSERSLRQHVVRQPVRELRHRVRGQRSDQEQVGASQVRVEILVRGPTGQRGEGLAAHEPIRAPRDERDHVVPGLDEQPRQLTRLVGGDPTGHPEEHLGHEHILPIGGKTAAHPRSVRLDVLGNVLASPRRRKR